MKITYIIVLTVILVVIFSGCIGEEKITPISTPEKVKETITPYQTPREEAPEKIFEQAKDVTNFAIQDLATKLNINESDITVDTIIPVEWTDKSLGYPETGKEYEFESISGYVILLIAKGKLYEYHSDRSRIIVPPSGPIEDMEEMPRIISNNTIDGVSRLIELAKKDLANRLNVTIEDVKLVKVVPREWSDTSLGYPEPERGYVQIIVPGFAIQLAVESTVYEYHSDMERVVAPPELRE